MSLRVKIESSMRFILADCGGIPFFFDKHTMRLLFIFSVSGLRLVNRVFIFLCFLSVLNAALHAEDYTVAILRDGNSLYFDDLIDQFKVELKSLSEGQRTLVFKDDYNAAFDADLVDTHLIDALEDESVDIIYAGGVIATEHALRHALDGLQKPVIGGALQLSDVGPNYLSKNGTSKLDNYTFIASPRRVFADLEQLGKLASVTKVHILIDEIYALVLEERLDLAQLEFAENLNLEVSFVLAGNTVESALANIPSDATAVYVTTMPRINGEALKALYASLSERKLPSLAMSGRDGVEHGALLGLASDNIKAVARRSALNVHFIAMGQKLDQLPVYLPLEDSLIINSETARKIGWSPDYDISLVAEFVNREFRFEGEPMNLVQAMSLAETYNIDVTIAREQRVRSRADVGLARSAFLPQVNAVGNGNYARYNDRINPGLTPQYADQASVGVQLQQVLFNDELLTTLRSQREVEKAAAFDAKSSELDAIESSALAYFECLRTQKLYDIERENLRLSENHYQFAKLRVEIGSADPSEVYRFEQLRAKDRASLISRETDRKNAVVGFNRLIGSPRDTQWSFEEISVGDQELYFMDTYLDPIVGKAGTFLKLEPFLCQYAIDNSPELMAFDLQIAAQGLVLKQKQRRYYLPEVELSADLTHSNKKSEFADRDSEGRAFAGISVTFPIFEGGRRRQDVLRQKSTIRILEAQRERAVQQLEEFAIVSFNNILSAHPSIRLNRRALKSAEKNYESAREKYSQGAASILDLLDAQETLLSQRQSAAVALYDYLKAIHRLQRSIAWFEFQQTNQAKQNWTDLFQHFLKENP